MKGENELLDSDNQLTEREFEVLTLLSGDQSAGEIGAALDISEQTVNRHLHEIYLKLGFGGSKGRLAAARWYWEHFERNPRRKPLRPPHRPSAKAQR